MTRARTGSLLAVTAACLGLAIGAATGLAQAPPVDADADVGAPPVTESVTVGSGTVALPQGWSWEHLSPMEMGAMRVEVAYAASADNRVQVLFAVIDPFGVDLQDWDQKDLLGPLALDLMRSSGYESDNFRVRRVKCRMNGDDATGRLVIFPKGKGRSRLISGLACGYADSSRWAIGLVLVDSNYDRPLLLERTVDEAAELVESFRFPE